MLKTEGNIHQLDSALSEETLGNEVQSFVCIDYFSKVLAKYMFLPPLNFRSTLKERLAESL